MESIIHLGIKCQECQVYPITGIRYNCLNCPCYNLCKACEQKLGKDHGHPLLKFRSVEQAEIFQKNMEKKKIIKKTLLPLNQHLNVLILP